MEIKLSVVIVTYNPGEIIFDCLASLLASVNQAATEIIVVDNNSHDLIVEQVSQKYPDIHLIQNSDNRGFAAANNQGLSQAKGSFLLLLNPDVIVHQEAVSRMISCLEENPSIAIAGPRTFDAQGQLALTTYGRYTPFTILWQYFGLDRLFPNQVFGQFRRQIRMAQQPFDAEWVQGSCMMIRREVYVQIGGLDEDLFLFTEEPDFCERAKAAGWRIVHIPSAEIEHRESTTISNYPLVKMRHYHRSPLHYFRKRQKPVSVLILKLGFTLELVIKFLIRLVQFSWLADSRARAGLRAYPIVLKEVWQF